MWCVVVKSTKADLLLLNDKQSWPDPLQLFTSLFLTFVLSLFLIFSRFLRLAGRRGSSTVQGTKNAGRGAAATSQSHTHVILHDTENLKKQITHILQVHAEQKFVGKKLY